MISVIPGILLAVVLLSSSVSLRVIVVPVLLLIVFSISRVIGSWIITVPLAAIYYERTLYIKDFEEPFLTMFLFGKAKTSRYLSFVHA